MTRTWIKIAKQRPPLTICKLNNQHWLIDGNIYQPAEIFDSCCNTQYNFDIGVGTSLALFYYKLIQQIGNVFYYNEFISRNEPIFIYK